jgi:hypothetical protein
VEVAADSAVSWLAEPLPSAGEAVRDAAAARAAAAGVEAGGVVAVAEAAGAG